MKVLIKLITCAVLLTGCAPQLIRALQSATLMDYEEYLPPPEP